jgi:CheY-like chemotaxis protein
MDEYRRILVVDDEEQVIFVLRNSLKKLGAMYEVVTASNGQEALERVREAPIDLLITDLKMPVMDGVTLTEAVRALDPKTPIIWLTSYSEWESDAQRLGVYRYILKPLDVDMIRQVAREGLEARPHAPEVELQERTVLIMDDNNDVRCIFSRALGEAGYKTYSAATVQQARDLLAQYQFDVFLCDIHMGGERGTTLLREQAALLQQGGTHIIMVSADACYRDLCAEMGVEFYIEKPVALKPLITLVDRLMTYRRVSPGAQDPDTGWCSPSGGA